MAAIIPLDNDAVNSALKNVWGQYRTWAITSQKQKSDVSRWRDIVLLLSISGAILGTLSQQLPIWMPNLAGSWWIRGLGFASGVALGLAAFFTKEIFSPDPEGKAVRARAAAEAFKSQAYLMATTAPPYDSASTLDDLYEKPDKVKKAVENLSSVTITEQQRIERIISAPMTVQDYINQRVNDQIQYYTRSAIANEKKVARGKWISWSLGAAGVVLGFVATQYPSAAAWVAVIGTLTAAIAARQYSGRYQFLILGYQAARQELETLKSRWEGESKTLGVAADKKLILACEQVISAENSAWMAELTKKPDKP